MSSVNDMVDGVLVKSCVEALVWYCSVAMVGCLKLPNFGNPSPGYFVLQIQVPPS